MQTDLLRNLVRVYDRKWGTRATTKFPENMSEGTGLTTGAWQNSEVN